jgi:hypothetical protein
MDRGLDREVGGQAAKLDDNVGSHACPTLHAPRQSPHPSSSARARSLARLGLDDDLEEVAREVWVGPDPAQRVPDGHTFDDEPVARSAGHHPRAQNLRVIAREPDLGVDLDLANLVVWDVTVNSAISTGMT